MGREGEPRSASRTACFGRCTTSDIPRRTARTAQKGRIGGIIWRDKRPAYFADKTGRLTLDDELFASGKLAFNNAGSDSGVYFGWFDSASKTNKASPRSRAPQQNILAVLIEGPSRDRALLPPGLPRPGWRRRLPQDRADHPAGWKGPLMVPPLPAARRQWAGANHSNLRRPGPNTRPHRQTTRNRRGL